jgi:hypothetical protein
MSAASSNRLIPLTEPPAQASFRGARAFAWLIVALFAAAAVAWIGAQVASVRAPWLFFPLAVGVALGAIAGGTALAMQLKHRPTLWFGTLMASAVIVVGMHFLAYRASLDAPRSGNLAMINEAFPDVAERHGTAPPAGFTDFLTRMAQQGRQLPIGINAQGGWAWATWGLDAAILSVAAILTVLALTASYYCDICGAYYRLVRQETLPGTRLRRLCETFDTQPPPDATGELRYLACRRGCGPERMTVVFLTPGARSRHLNAWIHPSDRAKLFQQLDQTG